MVETWLIFSIIAMLAVSVVPIIHRILLKKFDLMSYVFLVNIIPGIVFALASFGTFSVPHDLTGVVLAIISILIATATALIGMKATQLVEASERVPLKRQGWTSFSYLFCLILCCPRR
jgi:SNF family Na+-dependent transporter